MTLNFSLLPFEPVPFIESPFEGSFASTFSGVELARARGSISRERSYDSSSENPAKFIMNF